MSDTREYLTEQAVKKAEETSGERLKKAPRKKAPPKLAVIDQSGCTGCEACIVFCPVDCIEIVPGMDFHPQVQQVVEVDLVRCIGCSLCAKNCPWNTIEMLPYEQALKNSASYTLKSVCSQKTASDA